MRGGDIKGEEEKREGGIQLGTGCRDSSGWGTHVDGIYCCCCDSLPLSLRCTLLGSTLCDISLPVVTSHCPLDLSIIILIFFYFIYF